MFSSSAFHHPCPLLQWSDQECCQATHTEEILNITLGSHNVYLHIIPDPFSVECSFYNSHLRSQKQAQCHKLHRFQHSNPCGWLLRRQNSHHTTSALGTSALIDSDSTYCQRGRYSLEQHVHSCQVVLPVWHDSSCRRGYPGTQRVCWICWIPLHDVIELIG